MLNRYLKEEYKYCKAGYYTFVHGAESGISFPQDVFTLLKSLSDNSSTEDFINLHIKPSSLDMNNEYITRKNLIEGNAKPIFFLDKNFRLEGNTLYTNHFLYGNIKNKGKNSIHWAITNCNASRINIPLEIPFKDLNVSEIYENHKKELDNLHSEWIELNNSLGNMYIIAVPKNKISESIYYSNDMGGKNYLVLKNGDPRDAIYNTIDIVERFDTNLESMHNYHIDDTQFVLVMTQDQHGGSNPKSGIKIKRITGIEQDKLNEFNAKKETLFKKITESYYELEKNINHSS